MLRRSKFWLIWWAKVMALILTLVFPVIFNLAFFLVLGMGATTSQWLSWAAINVSYGAFMWTLREQVKANLSVLRFTVYVIGAAYWVIELVVGLVFMLVLSQSPMLSGIVQLVLLGLFVVVLLSSKMANVSTEQSLERQRAQGLFLQELRSGVSACHSHMNLAALGELEQALEVSPLASTPAVAALEQELRANLSKLQQAVAAHDQGKSEQLAATMLLQVKQRNAMLEGHGV